MAAGSPTLLDPADLAAWLEERLPQYGGRAELGRGVADDGDGFVYENARGSLVAVVRLISWDLDEAGERRSIRDIREQHVFLIDPAQRDEPGRVRVFVEAWASIMPGVLAALGDSVAMVMPHELVNFGPLTLARAETFDDFRRALLAKSRYGRFFSTRGGPRAPFDGRPAAAVRPRSAHRQANHRSRPAHGWLAGATAPSRVAPWSRRARRRQADTSSSRTGRKSP